MSGRRVVLGFVLLVVVLLVLGYLVMRGYKAQAALDLQTQAASSSAEVSSQPPADSLPYENAQYGFSFSYPQALSVKTYDEGDGAQTFAFQSTSPVEGFQLFIVPYTEAQVSQARFEKDEPSGVRNDPRAAVVGGASGAAFYGSDPMLGDTYEVWFIHGGYLYEVTTLKPLEDWLNTILTTWRFS